MSHLPPDWNDDPQLWKLLGKLPKEKAASNFAWMVQQKLAEAEKNPVSPPDGWKITVAWIWRGVAVTAACVVIFFVISQTTPHPSRSTALAGIAIENVDLSDEIAALQKGESEEELMTIAQHLELIQDFEIIQHLDQL